MTASPQYQFRYWPDQMSCEIGGKTLVSARRGEDGEVTLSWGREAQAQLMTMSFDESLAMLRCLQHLARVEAVRKYNGPNGTCPHCGKPATIMAHMGCAVGGCPLGNDL